MVGGVRRVALDPSQVSPGSTLRPIARFVVEREGVEQASVVFGRAEIFEREPAEYAVARLRWADGGLGAARAVVTAAVDSARSGAVVYLPINAATSPDHAARRGVAEACGFGLFQEKEGFWWADAGQTLPELAGLRVQPMSRIGSAAFVPLVHLGPRGQQRHQQEGEPERPDLAQKHPLRGGHEHQPPGLLAGRMQSRRVQAGRRADGFRTIGSSAALLSKRLT